jgi:hypothetical protein
MPIYWGRALTRLECALYAALMGVLIAMFLERALAYMELAERTAVELTVQHVNAALQIQRAAEMLQGRALEAPKVLQRHPFEIARVQVANLHPDVADSGALAELERGYWVYERSTRELIYLPQLHRRLQIDGPDTVLRFHLVGGGSAPYVLVPASKYSWD